MRKKIGIFGKPVGLDSSLFDDPIELERLSLRGRYESSIGLFSRSGRMITLADASLGRGPDRILFESVPPPNEFLPFNGWHFTEKIFYIGTSVSIELTQIPVFSSKNVTGARHFPGHLRSALASVRFAPNCMPELNRRLLVLSSALQELIPESVENPLLQLIGFGPGLTPSGDDALCGVLLTGHAFALGRKHIVNWLPRLKVEVLRFLSRTTRVSAAYLRFAVEGRATYLQERFFEALAKDRTTMVETAIKEVKAWGSTSGNDFLAGVRIALDLVRTNFEK